MSYEIIHPQEAVAIIRAMKPNPARRIHREQGYTACKFGELCAWKGYEEARWITEFMRDRVPGLPDDCLLFTTFRAFLEAERQIQP